MLHDFISSLGIPAADCSVYCDRFIAIGYEDMRSIKQFMSLHELLYQIHMKMGHLKRFLTALVRMDSPYDEAKERNADTNNKRFEIIDNIVSNIAAEDVALWFLQENIFEKEINQKVHNFLVVDNCVTGNILTNVDKLARFAHGDIDMTHLLELSYRFQLHHMNKLINQIVLPSGAEERVDEPYDHPPNIDLRNIEQSHSPGIKPLLSETFNQFKQGSELELPTGFPYYYNPSIVLESLPTRSTTEVNTENEETSIDGKLRLTSVLPILPIIPLKNLSLNQCKSEIGYVLLKEIGRGSCGVIHLALFMPTLKPFALKFIELSDPNKCKQLVKELQVIRQLSIAPSDKNSCYILRLYDYFHDHESNIVTLVLEYMGGGSLQRMIDLNYLGSEMDVAIIASSVLNALQMLHSIGIIHRDIKPGNILISSNGAIKLADFGISSDQNEKKQQETFVGTLLYMSPERIKGLPYGCSSDIWSLGICLYVYHTGVIPFRYNSSYWDLVETISGGLSESSISLLANADASKTVLDFVLLCTKTNPSDRSPVDALLEHSMLKIIPDENSARHLPKPLTLTVCDEEIIDMVDLVLEWQLENMNIININSIGHIPAAHIEDLAVELGYEALRMHSIFQFKSKNLLKFLQPLYSLAKSNQVKFQEIVAKVKNKSKLVYLMHVLDKLKAAGVAVMSESDIISISDVAASDIPDPSKPMTVAERNRQRTQKMLNSIYKDSYRFEVDELPSIISLAATESKLSTETCEECNYHDSHDGPNDDSISVDKGYTHESDNNLQLVGAPDALAHSTIDNIIADLRGCSEPTYHVTSQSHASKLPQAFHSELPILADYELNCIALPMVLYLESPLKRVRSTDSLCGTPTKSDTLAQFLRQNHVHPSHRISGGVLSRPRFLDCINCQRTDCVGCEQNIHASYDMPRIKTEVETKCDDEPTSSNIFTVVNQNYQASPTESDSSLSF